MQPDMLNLVVLQTSQPPGFARGWSVVPRSLKTAWSFLENDFCLLYDDIRELMHASFFIHLVPFQVVVQTCAGRWDTGITPRRSQT